MQALILGSGGREHAIAVSVAKSPQISKVFVAPGNGGTAIEFENILLQTEDFEAVAQCILAKQIQLLIIGPEKPLVDGLVDFLENYPHPWISMVHIIGPNQFCAQLEGSKAFSKMVMEKAGIPTAKAVEFTPNDWEKCQQYIEQQPLPIVIKADGLASGKGVAVCNERADAIAFAKSILLDATFGAENQRLLVEDFLDGIEVSMFVLTDGKHYTWLPEAKDYKRIFDGDLGPNTGGMGSVSPVPFVDAIFRKKVENRVVKPLLAELQTQNQAYKGFLFIGLMNCAGEPFVVEFNVRLGDPETQSILQRIDGDWVNSLLALKGGELDKFHLLLKPDSVATVVMSAQHYPAKPRIGDLIKLPEKLEGDCFLFHSGTQLDRGQLKTNGGRVFACTATGATLSEALQKSYALCQQVLFEGVHYRKDIGKDVLPK